MPWYRKRLPYTPCIVEWCNQRAMCEVYDSKKIDYGPHCDLHGEDRVTRENKEEEDALRTG